jgi:hypothetical protein
MPCCQSKQRCLHLLGLVIRLMARAVCAMDAGYHWVREQLPRSGRLAILFSFQRALQQHVVAAIMVSRHVHEGCTKDGALSCFLRVSWVAQNKRTWGGRCRTCHRHVAIHRIRQGAGSSLWCMILLLQMYDPTTDVAGNVGGGLWVVAGTTDIFQVTLPPGLLLFI